MPQAGRPSAELSMVFGQAELSGLRPIVKEFKLHARLEVEVCAWQDVRRLNIIYIYNLCG